MRVTLLFFFRAVASVSMRTPARPNTTNSDCLESDIASSYQTVVQFLTEQNKIRQQISLKAAAAARLVLDPRLLRSAEIIETE